MFNRLIAHGLISNGSKFLVIRRSKVKRGEPNFYPEYWDIPGGTVEDGELPQVAAIREIKEEVNLNASVENIIHEDSNQDFDKNAVFIRLVYRCKVNNIESQKIKLDPEEHTAYRWIESLSDLEGEQFVPYLKSIM